MKIWLDDERPMPDYYDTHVKTALECIALIKTGTVTHISLDHDLGCEHYSEPNNGYHVAKEIERLAYEGAIPPISMQVHTANPAGRKNICAALQAACKFWNKE